MTLIPNVGEKKIHICANDIDSKCWGKGDSNHKRTNNDLQNMHIKLKIK
jgi:hypothetical protein